MLRYLLFVSVLGLLSAAPVAAQESDDELARNHFLAGRSYFAQSRFEEAVREFEEAYRLSPRPELLRNISVAAERDGDLPRAIEAAEQYLAEIPDAPDQRTQEQRLETLRAQLAERAAPPPESSEPPAPVPSAETVVEGAEGGGGGPSGLLIGGLTSLGVALVSVAVLGTTAGLAEVNYARLEEECGPTRCPPSLAAVRDEGATLATISTAFTFVAIGTGVLGGVLLLIDALSSSSSPEAQAVRVTDGGLQVRF